MSKFLTDYVHHTVLVNHTSNEDLDNARGVVSGLVTEFSASYPPLEMLKLMQTSCLDLQGSDTQRHPHVLGLAERLRVNHSMAARGDTAPRWARAVALTVVDELQKKNTVTDSLLLAFEQMLLRASMSAGDTTYIQDLLRRAHNDVEAGARLSLKGRGIPEDSDPAEPEEQYERAQRHEDVTYDHLYPRLNLLWWSESAWSGALWKPYEDVPAEHRGLWMTEDFAALAPAGQAAEHFLLRILRREGVELKSEHALATHIQQARNTWTWGKSHNNANPPPLPDSLKTGLRTCAIGLPALAAQLGEQEPGQDIAISGADWYRQILRERLLLREFTAQASSTP